jgi:hypothetical protein
MKFSKEHRKQGKHKNSDGMFGPTLAQLLTGAAAALSLQSCAFSHRFTDAADSQTGLSRSETELSRCLKKQLGPKWAPDLNETKECRRHVSNYFLGQRANPTITVIAGNDKIWYFYNDKTNYGSYKTQERSMADAVRFLTPANTDCRAVISQDPFKWGVFAHAEGDHYGDGHNFDTQIRIKFKEDPKSEKSYGQIYVNEDNGSDDPSLEKDHSWKPNEKKMSAE